MFLSIPFERAVCITHDLRGLSDTHFLLLTTGTCVPIVNFRKQTFLIAREVMHVRYPTNQQAVSDDVRYCKALL